MTPPAGPSGGPRAPRGPRPESPDSARHATEEVADKTAEYTAEYTSEEAIEDATEVVEHELDDLVAVTRRERDEYLDALQRMQADFENYKKRMVRQQTDHLERAAEDLVTKVLPVLDAFDLARTHLGDTDNLSAEGKALVAGSTLLADTLAREGLERIDNPGAPFDPTTHEAVDHEGATAGDDAPEGPVVDEVLRAGYRWKGRVIRPAMVRVRG
jgi:molecular chaperone GrpE